MSIHKSSLTYPWGIVQSQINGRFTVVPVIGRVCDTHSYDGGSLTGKGYLST